MKVDIDYKFFQSIYLKNDPEQVEYLLNRVILEHKGRLSLEVMGPDGELFEVAEGLTSKERDMTKTLGIDKPED